MKSRKSPGRGGGWEWQRTAETRRGMLEAARQVFCERGFAEAGSVVVVSASHAFALPTLDPLVVDVAIDALEVQSQRSQSAQVAPVYIVRLFGRTVCVVERIFGSDAVGEIDDPQLYLWLLLRWRGSRRSRS